MPHDRDALITGIGLVSCLGSGVDAHWEALNAFAPVVDTETFPPFVVHPMAPLALDTQIPKRGDQRQMEAWQRIGVFAAGQALESAGVKGNTELLATMGMIVAAGGGERDYAVDAAIMSGYPKAANQGGYLNEHLLGDVRIASARIAAGQGDIMLVGGSYNAQRPDILVHYELGGLQFKGPFDGVWGRQAAGGGMALGSVGCFLVIESRAHAAARGASAYGHIAAIRTDRCRREPGQATANARVQFDSMAAHYDPSGAAVISGASGVAAATTEEAAFLASLGLPVRATATAVGHSLEPSFPASLALAARAVKHGTLFPPLETAEKPMAAPLTQALVTSWGHWRGESLALVTGA